MPGLLVSTDQVLGIQTCVTTLSCYFMQHKSMWLCSSKGVLHTSLKYKYMLHICTYMQTYAHIHAHMNTCAHMCTQSCTHTYMHTLKHTHTWTDKQTHTHTWTHLYTHKHTCIHVNIYTHMHTPQCSCWLAPTLTQWLINVDVQASTWFLITVRTNGRSVNRI